MKKLIALAVLSSLCTMAQATTSAPGSYTANLFTSLNGTLEGNDAYAQNINPNLSSGEYISSATISFNNVDLTVAGSTGHGYLYADLLNLHTAGLTTRSDGDAAGDYWATQYSGNNITSLGNPLFFQSVNSPAQNWNIVLTTAELSTLNSDLSGGSFSIGIDPDCHFTLGSATITYTVATSSVPDTATTVFLLGTALLGLEVVRRKFSFAK
jgi:hypothetical protein